MTETGVVEATKVTRPMTVQVLKTKAETALGEQFAAVEADLPGGAGVRRLRRAAIGAFAATGLPHRRIEEWKYTDLKSLLKEAWKPAIAAGPVKVSAASIAAALGPLGGIDAYRIVLVDGCYAPSLSTVDGLAREVRVAALADLLDQEPDGLLARLEPMDRADALVTLNTAFMTDGAVLDVAADAAPDKPILLVCAHAGREPHALATRHLVTIGANARVTLIEAHVSVAGASHQVQENALMSLAVGEGAALSHIKVTAGREGTVHLAPLQVSLAKASVYRPFQLTIGSGLTRTDMQATFAGEGAAFDLGAAFLIDHAGHADTTLVVDHAVPGCTSRELVKGVLDGHARGVFQGKVIVRPGAQKTDGKQMAQALMLSPDAEFDSKPELEIFADDVVCGHGSTAAELDDDLVFYCRARGIPLAEARALLVESFIGEAVDKIGHEAVRDALMELARSWLGRGQAQQAAA